ncbi:glycosyltransferase [Hahella sp. CR1]|uniref:glycosyltransferase n=1 Tax=Hahella sp. CR1 TaxID=2992807 RepID=UPI002442682D|nr:glycosyltransferase [Hahella sp. CR1]MDG9667315.1 glycosyltransferase [Hahella sp. CR1]
MLRKKVDIVIPVYRGLDETRECIESALDSMESFAQIIVINDCSPEKELSDYLRDGAEKGLFTLYENAENLGFVATVNRGMALNCDNDILLLNSDVVVPNSNWLIRLQDAAYKDKDIGSVTPFSNNATICSFPNFCNDNDLLLGLSVTELDHFFSSLSDSSDVIDVPTGVGFCMYIRRDCLNAVGLFDYETFGKGYGEENDWCQRAIQSGWRNVHSTACFVYHKGGVSFSDEQDPRKAKALDIINRLYPKYLEDVSSYIRRDPALSYRILALMRIIANLDRPKVLLLDHGLGGGVVQHVEELAQSLSGLVHFLRLSAEKEGFVKLTFSLTEDVKDVLIFDVETQYSQLIEFLIYMGVGHVHIHHTMRLPTRLWDIYRDLNCDYDVTVHDYYHVNGNPTLTDSNGIYCGDHEARDELCFAHYPIPVSAKVWREYQLPLLERAKRVIFPSSDTKDRFCKVFNLDNTVVAWHPDSEKDYTVPKVNRKIGMQKGLKILVLGALSREKGALLLESVADLMSSDNIEFHLLGYAFRPLSKNIHTHGAYSNAEVPELIDSINPDVIWFPALWPETYSYTLSLSMRSNSVIVAPNIGAFAERLSGRESSIVVPWNMSLESWVKFWKEDIFKVWSSCFEYSEHEDATRWDGFYKKAYVDQGWLRKGQGEISIKNVHRVALSCQAKKSMQNSRGDTVVLWLWRLRMLPIFRVVSSYIPFKLQRYIKRRLSTKPIHEVVKGGG